MDKDLNKDFYTILEIRRNATNAEIKNALKVARLRWHPDKHQDPESKKIASEIYKQCEDAAAILLDPKKRKIYDKFGMNGFALVQKNDLSENDDILESLLDREDELKGIDFPKGGEVSVGFNVPTRTFDNYSVNHNFHSIISENKFLVFGASVNGRKGEIGFLTYADYYFKVHENVFNVGTFIYNSMLGYRVGIQRTIHDSKYFLGFESLFREQAVPVIKIDKTDKVGNKLEVKTGCSVKWDNISLSSSLKYKTNVEKEEYVRCSVSGETPVAVEYQRERVGFGISFTNSSFIPDLTWTLKKKLAPKKTYSISSVFGFSGVTWVLNYTQNDHSFSLPVTWTNTLDYWSMLYVLAMPLVWSFVQSPYLLSSGYYRYNEAQKNRILKKVLKANHMQQNMMMEAYKESMQNPLLKIVEARYGRNINSEHRWDESLGWYNWMEVTIPLQIAVYNDSDGPKLQLNNLYLAGVVDTAPKEDKYLYVEYMFRDRRHVATFSEGETIKLPMMEHAVKEDEEETRAH